MDQNIRKAAQNSHFPIFGYNGGNGEDSLGPKLRREEEGIGGIADHSVFATWTNIIAVIVIKRMDNLHWRMEMAKEEEQ